VMSFSRLMRATSASTSSARIPIFGKMCRKPPTWSDEGVAGRFRN
jgi:hypothetical protein